MERKIREGYSEKVWLPLSPWMSQKLKKLWPEASKALDDLFAHFCLGYDIDESDAAKIKRHGYLLEFYEALQGADRATKGKKK